MVVECQKMPTAIQGSRSNPDIVNWDRGSGSPQICEEPSVVTGYRRCYRQDRDEGLGKELRQEYAVLPLAAAELEAGFQFTENDGGKENDLCCSNEVEDARMTGPKV